MEVWHQVYAPLGGPVTSALVASIPLIALVYMLAFRKSKGHHAAIVAVICAFLCAVLGWGMPTGTTMAFCMSAVAASIPEAVMLRQVMTTKLQAAFFAWLWVMFTLTGWLLNALQGILF